MPTDVLGEVEYLVVGETDGPRILEVYSLLEQELGVEGLEDIESFLGTVSASTDPGVVPSVMAAEHADRLVGAVVGAYLKDLNIGMVLYSAVRKSVRGRGIYSTLRASLVEDLNALALQHHRLRDRRDERRPSIDYLVSELDGDSWLREEYLGRWGAFVADCDYMQPRAQGLEARPMDLVLQPIGVHSQPSRAELVAIVREIYERVYRLADPDRNAEFRGVVQSLRRPVVP